MTQLKIIFGSAVIAIGLWGCSNISNQTQPPMTQVSLQICGEQLVRKKIEKTCLSHTGIYWGELSQKDIKLVEMRNKNSQQLNYYFVLVSAPGCVADWSAPRPQAAEIIAIKSMYSQKLPTVEILNLVEVEEEKKELLVEETKEKLAFATLMGSQSTYTQPTCQYFKQIHNRLKATGYQEIIY